MGHQHSDLIPGLDFGTSIRNGGIWIMNCSALRILIGVISKVGDINNFGQVINKARMAFALPPSGHLSVGSPNFARVYHFLKVSVQSLRGQSGFIRNCVYRHWCPSIQCTMNLKASTFVHRTAIVRDRINT